MVSGAHLSEQNILWDYVAVIHIKTNLTDSDLFDSIG